MIRQIMGAINVAKKTLKGIPEVLAPDNANFNPLSKNFGVPTKGISSAYQGRKNKGIAIKLEAIIIQFLKDRFLKFKFDITYNPFFE
jgi:hypothetical protein